MSHDGTPTRDIVLITVDSLQYDYVAADDAPAPGLAGLSALADGGTFFTNAFSNATITKGSFLSIFSGTYPWMFGSIDGGFDTGRPHLAERLSAAGYATAGFNTNPYLSSTYGYDRGFDYYMGRDTGENLDRTTLSSKYWPVLKESLLPKRAARAVRSAYGTAGRKLGLQLGGDPYVPAEEVNEAVFEYLEDSTGPRFLWIHYMDVHTPYYPREGTESEDERKRHAVKLFHRANERRADASDADLDRLERLYEGEVEYFDRRLAELLDGLDARLDLSESLVVFGSDHGEAFGDHDAVFHPDGVLYDDLVHVPLVVNGPGFDAGAVSTPVSNADIVPTLLEFAGAETPSVCVGDSLAGIVADPPDGRAVFAGGHDSDTGVAMVATERYKLIRDLRSGTEELYDRAADPEETTDVLDARPDAARRLRAALDERLEVARSNEAEPSAVEVDDGVKTRLRMLGYDE
jgi:arylsulfatase A-like enzyme